MTDSGTSTFFAMLGRLRWIKRWGLKRVVIEEDVTQHSFAVSCIAHALAVIHHEVFGGDIDAGAVAAAALYHDASELITGDLPSPIKYHSAHIRDAYRAIEREAEQQLLNHLPPPLRNAFRPLLIHAAADPKVSQFVKAADVISAYLKCCDELRAGNTEFIDAKADIAERINRLDMPEVGYFMQTFVRSYDLTLDKLVSSAD